MSSYKFLKIFGGKYYLKHWIIEHFPLGYEELAYCEPCVGGASVFLARERSDVEVINDLDYGTFAIWTCTRNWPFDFHNDLRNLHYADDTFEKAKEDYATVKKHCLKTNKANLMKAAISKFVLLRMSRAGMCESFAWSDRQRGGQPGDLNAWENAVKSIPQIAKRLKDVYIECMDCVENIDMWAGEFGPKMLFYIDPPYVKEKDGGKRTSENGYNIDFTIEDHKRLLEVVLKFDSKFVISGYETDLYNEHLIKNGWHIHKKEVVNHAAQSDTKKSRIEVLYTNFA